MADIQHFFTIALQENNYVLPAKTSQQLTRYLELMLAWNRVFNLTNITQPEEMVYLHLIDSLAVAPYLYGNRLLDVGTGAGLPGLPLAILNPEQEWTLLDKVAKKTRFLTQVIAELKLNNVTVVTQRCEDFHPAQGFDSILSRAFGTIRLLIETTEHLLNTDGMFIVMKAKYPQSELQDIPNPFIVQDVVKLEIKGKDIERHLVRLRKK